MNAVHYRALTVGTGLMGREREEKRKDSSAQQREKERECVFI